MKVLDGELQTPGRSPPIDVLIVVVKRVIAKALEVYDLWKQTYPRDAVPYINSGTLYSTRNQQEEALQAYMTDNNPRVCRPNAVMRGMLVQEADGKRKPVFSNAELKLVSEYLSNLPGDLRTVPQSRFHSTQH